jgi:hypothetical protein
MAMMLAAPVTAAQPAMASVDYAKPANWLCLPGRVGVCSSPPAATWLHADGYGAAIPGLVASDPPVDCFYVYPTVSLDRGLNSDLVVGEEEKFAAQSQFARFSSVCRTYAPIYRQMTVSAIASMAFGSDITPAARVAYGDVASAWRTYLAQYNRGRPFVLIGHSQGSALLIQLIAREIEGKPVARQMKLAILPGYNVLVPPGKLVGGSFKSTPLCSRPGETGCVNPASPGSRGWGRRDSYWYARSSNPAPGGPISWSSEGPPPTPYLRTDGLVSGKCVNDGGRGYLSIRTNHAPGDKRTDRVGGEVAVLGMFLPGWGMHLADMPEAQGDLVRRVGELAIRPRTAARP